MEMWTQIRSFESYSVSNHGRVRNDTTGRYMTPLQNQHGVVSVGLTKNLVQYKRSVTLLVARAFIHNPRRDVFNTPINLDGDRFNNRVENLMWRPRWFASKYYKQLAEPPVIDEPLEEVKSGRLFDNSREAAVTNGLLEKEIYLSILENTYVWPTYQVFRNLKTDTK